MRPRLDSAGPVMAHAAAFAAQPAKGAWAARPGQRIGMPDRVRAITRRWISLVPSKMV